MTSQRGDAGSLLVPELPASASWSYSTRRFRLLDHDFAVRSTNEAIGRYLDELFAPSVVDGEPSAWYSIVAGVPGMQEDELYVDGERVAHTERSPFVLTYLFWHINQEVIRKSCARHVLVHAAAAARDGVGIVMPAAPEAGKTTLVAGLVSGGFKYLSDEAAAIDPETLKVAPFPKPLSIDKGSREVLAHLEPRPAPGLTAHLADQWQVSPLAIRTDAVSGPVSPRLVILPYYCRDAETLLEPLGRTETLLAMLRHTFHFDQAGRRNFEVLARLVAEADCFRLTVGDLTDACGAVSKLVGRLND